MVNGGFRFLMSSAGAILTLLGTGCNDWFMNYEYSYASDYETGEAEGCIRISDSGSGSDQQAIIGPSSFLYFTHEYGEVNVQTTSTEPMVNQTFDREWMESGGDEVFEVYGGADFDTLIELHVWGSDECMISGL